LNTIPVFLDSSKLLQRDWLLSIQIDPLLPCLFDQRNRKWRKQFVRRARAAHDLSPRSGRSRSRVTEFRWDLAFPPPSGFAATRRRGKLTISRNFLKGRATTRPFLQLLSWSRPSVRQHRVAVPVCARSRCNAYAPRPSGRPSTEILRADTPCGSARATLKAPASGPANNSER
jgi:hypothetical protein